MGSLTRPKAGAQRDAHQRELGRALGWLGAMAWSAALLSGCGTSGTSQTGHVTRADPPGAAQQAPRGGGYYLDDGPGDNPPADLHAIPDAIPRVEPLHRGSTRPYTVLGRNYVPMTGFAPYKARGVASWYGRRYHGKQTSNGEIYDMYGMSAAHPVLPIPSYVRVTNVTSGRSVIVRVNDRGPFIDGRLIDLSYTAAYKLGLLAGGSGQVEVEVILPGDRVVPTAPTVALAVGPEVPPPAREPALEPPSSLPLPVPSSAVQVQAGGYYVQLGAFSSRENAAGFLEKVRGQAAGIADEIQLTPRDGLFRVQSGPYATRTEASQVAERVSAALALKPVIVGR
jgi:rare lipoprotein A